MVIASTMRALAPEQWEKPRFCGVPHTCTLPVSTVEHSHDRVEA